ncbi:MAG: carboxypeptidase-like regulatory domain-containing protein [Bryobacteraceae bacterium]|nr:carboxypeptidase-like regulatory domain-containing protein [Bryobacteraceae bacterium]MCX7604549.1 carboxypeptidase-like regulatory domain-containing protein [Bryobacteraceae bacterium]
MSRWWVLAWFALLPAWADVSGVVVNRTTGKPQAGVVVSLTSMGQGGMAPAGSARTDAEGRFTIRGGSSGPMLVQAIYKGVLYSRAVQGTGPLEVDVFESSAKVPEVRVTQHMMLVEGDGKEWVVNETILFENSSTLTWSDPERGTLRFTAPPEAGGNVRVRATSPASVPVEREPRRVRAGEYALDFPVKPGGETRFDISYKLPAKDPMVIRGRILHPPGPVRLVVPEGIRVESASLKELGREPGTRAMIYDVTTPEYELRLAGTGALQSAPATEQEEDGPRIERILPPGYERWWKAALALAAAFLALSFWAQWLKSASAGDKSAR